MVNQMTERDFRRSQTHLKAEQVIRQNARQWRSTIVARPQVEVFSGGAYTPSYLANQDSEGTGPEGAFMLGRKMVYPVESLTEWLIKRIRAAHKPVCSYTPNSHSEQVALAGESKPHTPDQLKGGTNA